MSVRLKLADVSGESVSLSRSHHTEPTVREYVEGWLTTYAEVHCKPTTAKGYRQLLTLHVYPLIGDRRLDQVARADIKHMIGVLLGKKLKKSSVHNILTPLKEAYHHAIDDGPVANNPVVRTGRFTRTDEDRRATIQPLTRTEVGVLLEAAEVHAKSVATLLLCAVRTGLRQGELIGLQWGDVDFHGKFIEVRRAIVRGQLTTTKTRKIRRVDATPQLTDSLKQFKETRTLEAAMSGKPFQNWVFLSPLGCRWDERNLRRAFYKVLDPHFAHAMNYMVTASQRKPVTNEIWFPTSQPPPVSSDPHQSAIQDQFTGRLGYLLQTPPAEKCATCRHFQEDTRRCVAGGQTNVVTDPTHLACDLYATKDE